MSSDPEGRRRYNNEEVNDILKQAAELQKAKGKSSAAGPGRGLTLPELQQIAADVGIDPHYVVEAVSALDTTSSPRRSLFLGAAASFQLERTIEGEVPESEFTDLVDVARKTMKEQGKVSKVLGSLEERFGDKGYETHVTITPRRGQTKIQILGEYWGIQFLVYFFWGLVSLFSFVAWTQSKTSIEMCIGLIGGVYLAARTIWTWIGRRQERTLRTLLQQLGCHAAEMARPVSQAEDEAKTAPPVSRSHDEHLSEKLSGEPESEHIPISQKRKTKTFT